MKKRWIFGSQLPVDRFSKFKSLNALEFNSELISEANFVVKLNFLSKKCQTLREKSTVYKHSRYAKTGPDYNTKFFWVKFYIWTVILFLILVPNFSSEMGVPI